jgi:hypothetical protein
MVRHSGRLDLRVARVARRQFLTMMHPEVIQEIKEAAIEERRAAWGHRGRGRQTVAEAEEIKENFLNLLRLFLPLSCWKGSIRVGSSG